MHDLGILDTAADTYLLHHVTQSAQNHLQYGERITKYDARNDGCRLQCMTIMCTCFTSRLTFEGHLIPTWLMQEQRLAQIQINQSITTPADMHTVSPARLDSCNESMDAGTMHSSVLRLMAAPDDALNQSMCV